MTAFMAPPLMPHYLTGNFQPANLVYLLPGTDLAKF
jgi:hypothetical protein